MGFRFRRSIRVLPGLRLNLGKRGVSATVGVRGAHVTLGKTGVRTTVGIPGTGVSYTTLSKSQVAAPEAEQCSAPEPAPTGSSRRGWLWIALIVAALIAWWALS